VVDARKAWSMKRMQLWMRWDFYDDELFLLDARGKIPLILHLDIHPGLAT
jgi:hypothetical protein